MADTLQTYQLPNSHLPGSPLLSKYICREPSVMVSILTWLFDSEPPNDYYCGDTCLIDGSRCDILYQSQSSKSVMVQIQKKVTQDWLRHVMQMCSKVIDEDDDLPILVIFSLYPLPSDITAMCRISSSTSYAYDLVMPIFTKKIKLFCPELVNLYLENTFLDYPQLPPIVVLSYFFSSQHPSAIASNFSQHPFYENLYRHAFHFCHRLNVDLQPMLNNTLKTTNDNNNNSNSNNNKNTGISPTQRRSASRMLTMNRSMAAYANQSLLSKKDIPININPYKRRPSSPTGRIVLGSSPSSPTPTNTTNSSSSPRKHKKGKNVTLTTVSQHDFDVIIDYCQEQIDLNKSWQTIYDEGYGKYFVYKNRESLRRSIVRHLRDNNTPVITKVSQHNMKTIVTFCKKLVDKGVPWDIIFDMGKGKHFAYKSTALLRKDYDQHLNMITSGS